MLITQLFDLYVRRNYPPDILSREFDDDGDLFILFEWESGKTRSFGYTEKSYDAIWEKFNSYWNSLPNPPKADSLACRMFFFPTSRIVPYPR